MQKFVQCFSLIELIIVIAIISLLVAVIIPSYQGFVIRAKDNACLLEAKAYSNYVYYNLFEGNEVAISPPKLQACVSITNAENWNKLSAQKYIIAISKSDATIQCDISHGASCEALVNKQ